MTKSTRSAEDDPRVELRQYLIGLVGALLLTGAAFAIVVLHLLPTMPGLGVLAVLALVQIAVHLRFFMHIDLKKSHRDDLQLILFTALIVLLMTGGSLWILSDLHARM